MVHGVICIVVDGMQVLPVIFNPSVDVTMIFGSGLPVIVLFATVILLCAPLGASASFAP